MSIFGLMKSINLIDKIERRKVLRRLNTINVLEGNRIVSIGIKEQPSAREGII